MLKMKKDKAVDLGTDKSLYHTHASFSGKEEEKTTLQTYTDSAVHGLPLLHRATLPFAGPQPATTMHSRPGINTQAIPSEMCVHPSLGLSTLSSQRLPVNPTVKGVQPVS